MATADLNPKSESINRRSLLAGIIGTSALAATGAGVASEKQVDTDLLDALVDFIDELSRTPDSVLHAEYQATMLIKGRLERIAGVAPVPENPADARAEVKFWGDRAFQAAYRYNELIGVS